MKYLLLSIIGIFAYTFIVYKYTVNQYEKVTEHVVYGKIIPYEFLNDGDLARVHLHYKDDTTSIIDSVTLTNVMPTFDIEHPTMGSMHIDISSMQLMLRDRGQWIQFESYDELNNYIASRFPSDEYDN